MRVEVRGASDIGLKRSQNEDHLGHWSPADPAARARRGTLLAVADGMGGALAGEVASRIAVETLLSAWAAAPGGDPLADLTAAAEAANHAVYHESLAHPDLKGMGTTLCAVAVRGTEGLVAHVGDSRAYLVRDGVARALTDDHSLVAQLVRSRQLTVEQARVDPRRNVITRSVGVGPTVEGEAARLDPPLRAGDTLVLCTDGLHGLVSDAELAVAATAAGLDAVCADLVRFARERGGYDNITVLVARLTEGE